MTIYERGGVHWVQCPHVDDDGNQCTWQVAIQPCMEHDEDRTMDERKAEAARVRKAIETYRQSLQTEEVA